MTTVEPNAFVAEVYRRMTLRTVERSGKQLFVPPPTPQRIAAVAAEYAPHLPSNKDARILDIGYGNGWFMAACKQLGYSNLTGAEFGDPDDRAFLRTMGCELKVIENDIGDFLTNYPEQFDFIHMSHVIEHIPKYSLFWIGDSLFRALRKNGSLFLRTPNMEGPASISSYYVTLGHEYGFAGSNLISFLTLCGFEDIRLIPPPGPITLRQKVGTVLRYPFLLWHRAKHRFFGVNQGGQFQSELIVMGTRRNAQCLFDEKYR
jgi:2-polyprenyl-3-methyl-5-hydroxy-6-metoxy-1,4-benzoquinol methylase